MDTISYVLKKLHTLGINVLTIADTANSYLDEKIKKLFAIHNIDDARSACFFSLGKSQTLNEPTGIIVESKYIDHLYSGLVESWFQQISITVIVLDENNNTDYQLYNRCINKIIDLRNNETLDNIANEGPTMIILSIDKVPQSTQNKEEIIKNLLPLNAKIYQPEHKYGAISKYVGYLCGTSNTIYCIMPLSWLRWDLNIFNNRYTDNRFRLILIKDIEIDFKIEQWLKANNIELFNGETDSDITKIVNINKPAVLIFK